MSVLEKILLFTIFALLMAAGGIHIYVLLMTASEKRKEKAAERKNENRETYSRKTISLLRR